jgi:hypothetical protein
MNPYRAKRGVKRGRYVRWDELPDLEEVDRLLCDGEPERVRRPEHENGVTADGSDADATPTRGPEPGDSITRRVPSRLRETWLRLLRDAWKS